MFAIVVKYSSWWLSCTRKATLQHHVCHLLSSIHIGGYHVQDRSPYSIMFAIVVKYSSWWLSCTRKITLQHHVCHSCQVFILVAVMYKEDHLTASCLPLLSSIHIGGCQVKDRSPYSIMFAIFVKYSSLWLSCTSKITLQHDVCHCKYFVPQQTMLSFIFVCSTANNAQLYFFFVPQQTMLNFFLFLSKQCSALFFLLSKQCSAFFLHQTMLSFIFFCSSANNAQI